MAPAAKAAPSAASFNIKDLNAHMKDVSPEYFKVVSKLEHYDLQEKEIRDLDGDEGKRELLHVGHMSRQNGPVELWACPDRDDEAAVGEKAKLLYFKGESGERLEEIDITTKANISQPRFMKPYVEVGDFGDRKGRDRREKGRQRLSVFVQYIFMLKDKSRSFYTKDRTKALKKLEEAHKMAAEAIDPSLKEKKGSAEPSGSPKADRRKSTRAVNEKKRSAPSSEKDGSATEAPPAKKNKKSKVTPAVPSGRIFPGLKPRTGATVKDSDGDETPDSDDEDEQPEVAETPPPATRSKTSTPRGPASKHATPLPRSASVPASSGRTTRGQTRKEAAEKQRKTLSTIDVQRPDTSTSAAPPKSRAIRQKGKQPALSADTISTYVSGLEQTVNDLEERVQELHQQLERVRARAHDAEETLEAAQKQLAGAEEKLSALEQTAEMDD